MTPSDVFESLMCRARVNQMRQRQLVDMAQPLKRTRIQNFALFTIQADKHVNGVSDLMKIPWHMDAFLGAAVALFVMQFLTNNSA